MSELSAVVRRVPDCAAILERLARRDETLPREVLRRRYDLSLLLEPGEAGSIRNSGATSQSNSSPGSCGAAPSRRSSDRRA